MCKYHLLAKDCPGQEIFLNTFFSLRLLKTWNKAAEGLWDTQRSFQIALAFDSFVE